MRILQLSWEYPPLVYGGLGRHLHALSEAFASAGHEVTVVTQHVAGAPYDSLVNGVRVVRVPQDPPQVPMSDLLAWVMGFNHSIARAALRVARETPPDIVHGHDWLVAHAGTTLKDALGVPLVATVHATEAGRHQGWLPGDLNRAIHTVEWWLTYEARRVITCSSHMRWEVNRLFGPPRDKLDVIPNGVDLGSWNCGEAAEASVRRRYGGGPLLLYTGRLEWEKGVHTLLAALPGLRRRHPGLRLVVAGRGSQEEELRGLARRLRLGRAVAFTGWLGPGELSALTAAADCAVVPSIYEPFGMVALEAAAAGTPLVVSDTGGLREFITHGVTGLLVPPGDATQLAGAVTTVLRDEVLARRLVREARAVLARDYTWVSVARRTAVCYERAIREERALQAGLAARARPLRVVVREGNLLARD
ncbi:MAG: glycosyltransferase family 4 protein [Carbonactinosporaceae bacterium]